MSATRDVSRYNWELEADPDTLDTAAENWRQLSESLDGTLSDRITACRPIADDWEGDDADSWRKHHKSYKTDLQAVIEECRTVAGHVEDAASAARTYQGRLDAALDELLSKVPHGPTGPLAQMSGQMITFRPEQDGHDEAISAAIAEAVSIRGEFATEMDRLEGEFTTSAADFRALVRTWKDEAMGIDELFDTPPEAEGPSIMVIDGRWVFNAGDGGTEVTVKHDPPPDGPLKIFLKEGKKEWVYDAVIPDGVALTIRTGTGADTITVPPGTDVGVTVLAGDGGDTVAVSGGDDHIIGGSGKDHITSKGGNDYVSAGAGGDYVETHGEKDFVSGGRGDDILYTLGDSSTVFAGGGNDYIGGGAGNNLIHTGDNGTDPEFHDIVSGGRGDDRIIAGDGIKTVYAGAGDDQVLGTDGSDKVYAESTDTVESGEYVKVEVTEPPSWIEIEGSPEFVARVQADLHMYSASPNGQEMLAGLEEHHHRRLLPDNNLTIKETGDDNGHAHFRLSWSGHDNSSIEYNPSYEGGKYENPPAGTLYHELSHIHSYWSGASSSDELDSRYGIDEGVKEDEYQATGLKYDHDDDPDTPDRIHPEQPIEVTENGLRREMGLPDRPNYNWRPR